jgi:hypothetical protein
MIRTVSLPESLLSLAASFSVYVPLAEKVTVVLAALALAKEAAPGPLTLLQV